MIGVWEFSVDPRDVRDKAVHPATFPIDLAKRVVSLFSHVGEVVLDPFVGSGTTLVACKELSRHGIGIDLSGRYCQLAKERLKQGVVSAYFNRALKIRTEVVCDDARNVLDHLPENSVDLIFTSPPYANVLDKERTNKSRRDRESRAGINEQYSDDEMDLGTLSPSAFFESLAIVLGAIFKVLKPSRRLAINMGDFIENESQSKAFAFPLLKECAERSGFELKNAIIWDKRKWVQNTGIFGYPSNFIALNACYEYVFDFASKKTI